ncbi:MAG: DUF362 domain-containing protein [Saprospiraceae bacterium]|nr:DUF362 domain-containing protein [Saprospiraceae bacterium]
MLKKVTDKGFVYIKKFYDGINPGIDDLAGVYNNYDLLCESIENLISNELNSQNCKDKKIFLKPNWVKHSSNPHDELCLRTHDQVVIALTEILCRYQPGLIIIGDAPIQGCKWDQMLSKTFYNRIIELSEKSGVPVRIKDLRRKIMDLSKDSMISESQGLEDFVIVDVGKASYLEEVTKSGENLFRVTHYNPDRFMESHKPGVHKYCITKELFEADIVISIPKIKTHEKSGITNALKNIVGLNGDKDFLPHHRIGGTNNGGDAYPGHNPVRYWAELLYDKANRSLGKKSYWLWIRLASLVWKLSLPGPTDRFGAGWYGNDTTWRMVMDLNLVSIYALSDGTMSSQPQRLLYSLCDGIIGGQKDGPLFPEPLPLGILMFTNDSAWADISAAILMGMDISKLPLLQAAREFSSERKTDIKLNGQKVDLNYLKSISITAQMPGGWINYKN